jgi:hypothetical protein
MRSMKVMLTWLITRVSSPPQVVKDRSKYLATNQDSAGARAGSVSAHIFNLVKMAYRRDNVKDDWPGEERVKTRKHAKRSFSQIGIVALSLFGAGVVVYSLVTPTHKPPMPQPIQQDGDNPRWPFVIDDSKIQKVKYDIENLDENVTWDTELGPLKVETKEDVMIADSKSYVNTLTDLYHSARQQASDTIQQADLLRKSNSKDSFVKTSDPLPKVKSVKEAPLNPKDFALKQEDWDLTDKPVELVDKDFVDSFKRLGERLRIFIKQWEKYERLYYEVIVPSWSLDRSAEGQEYKVQQGKPVDFTLPRGFSQRLVDDYRAYIGKFENLMFPWIKPYHASLLDYKRELLLNGQRGIVLAVGKDQVHLGLFLVRSIRFVHKSKLPIEVWHIGEDDLPGWVRGYLASYPDVAVRDITKVFDMGVLGLKGWDVKPFAMLASRFREVMFMDADAVFLESPDSLFEHPSYVRTGSLFYHDRMTMMGGDDRHVNFVKSFVPEPYSETLKSNWMFEKKTVHVQESGVVLVDKVKHFRGFLGTAKMNEIDARDKITYHIVRFVEI